MRTKTFIFSVLFLFLTGLPVLAVFEEKNLNGTLSSLRNELRQEYNALGKDEYLLTERHTQQHFQMVSIMKKCNELSLMLYSQKQNSTFEMAYALKEVTREYEDFKRNRLPYDEILSGLDADIQRYSRLLESLRRLPPALNVIDNLPDSLRYHNDSVRFDIPGLMEEVAPGAFVLDNEGCADRDSCVLYATQIVKCYSDMRNQILLDSKYYDQTSLNLKESYDYAQERYQYLQKKVFAGGQQSFFSILSNPLNALQGVWKDLGNKYGFSRDEQGVVFRGKKFLFFILVQSGLLCLALLGAGQLRRLLRKRFTDYGQDSPRKGTRLCFTLFASSLLFAVLIYLGRLVGSGYFATASSQFVIFAILNALILLSILVRVPSDKVKNVLQLHLPMMTASFIVIFFRVLFVPNSVMNLAFAPLLLVLLIFQLRSCLKYQGSVQVADNVLCWISLGVISVVMAMSLFGYGFIGMVTLIWWYFQMSLIELLMALKKMLLIYKKERMNPKIETWRQSCKYPSISHTKGATFHLSWFYDLAQMTLIPLSAVISVPLCIRLALGIFDFSELCSTYFNAVFFDVSNASGEPIFSLTVYKIVATLGMFYIFRYLSHAAHALYQNFRYVSYMRAHNRNYVHNNEINFSLANSLISIFVWFFYVVIVINLLKIPTGAVTIIAGGLSAGLGLAMKDIINNFICGIQLMSGRLRVGDWVESDGIRGRVSAINYQSTQIDTLDGAVMSFLNASLFNKSFKNLTMNNSYEFVKIVVGVKYGSDIAQVRSILREAASKACGKDEFGRDIVDPDRGVDIVFEEFSASSVDVALKQFVLVSQKAAYTAQVKELVYNALNDNHIEIPFPQRDIHIRND